MSSVEVNHEVEPPSPIHLHVVILASSEHRYNITGVSRRSVLTFGRKVQNPSSHFMKCVCI